MKHQLIMLWALLTTIIFSCGTDETAQTDAYPDPGQIDVLAANIKTYEPILDVHVNITFNTNAGLRILDYYGWTSIVNYSTEPVNECDIETAIFADLWTNVSFEMPSLGSYHLRICAYNLNTGYVSPGIAKTVDLVYD